MEPRFARGFRSWLIAALSSVNALVAFADNSVSSSKAEWARVEEMTLPTYLQAVLVEHQPVIDIMPSGDRAFWLMSKGSLWLWRLESKGLTHINLDQGDPSHAPLQAIGTDGIAIFAASATSLYQVIWPDRRVFRYALPKGPNESSLEFSGTGDDFRVIHTRGILRFDRYGKTVKLEHPFKSFPFDGKFKYQPANATLWRIQGKVLEQASAITPDLRFKMLLKTHNPLLDLALDGPGMVVHTPYAVLRINPSGKLLKSIPVEGHRTLLTMHVTSQVHAYIFSDGLLEVYNPKRGSSWRAKLDLPTDIKIKKMIVEDDLVGILTEATVLAYKLRTNE